MKQKRQQIVSLPLLDTVRPVPDDNGGKDGQLKSVVMATYGLSLEQPDFFTQDFLPTLFGRNSFRGRGNATPATIERDLGEIYCGLVCDAHALAFGARPSLRIDVVPIARPRHHAKILLIHREHLIRLILTSANLTHEGYRRQREFAATLDFRPNGATGLPAHILIDAIEQWLDVLGNRATPSLRNTLESIIETALGWRKPAAAPKGHSLRVVFGGGARPLWKSLVESWPEGEPVLNWRICSPFWPRSTGGITPFEAIAEGLQQRRVSFAEASLELICPADAADDRGQPVFPFPLVRRLRQQNFPVRRGRIVAARLDALADEIPEKMAESNRPLHAKIVLLRGPRTVVAMIGSANFTGTGLGVGKGEANIEAGILLTCPADFISDDFWRPPIIENTAVNWANCAAGKLSVPATAEDDPVDWPDFLRRVELDLHPAITDEPSGRLHIEFEADEVDSFEILLDSNSPVDAPELIYQYSLVTDSQNTPRSIPVSPDHVGRLLIARTVIVRWGGAQDGTKFPINVSDTAKTVMPLSAGAQPDELQLLAQFHGRSGEDELFLQLEDRSRRPPDPPPGQAQDRTPSLELQSYLIREFIESLPGMRELLNKSIHSPRAFGQALRGDFSPIALAKRILQAFRSGRRSATATAFQFVELLRLVDELRNGAGSEVRGIRSVIDSGIDDLMKIIGAASGDDSFVKAWRDSHFDKYLRHSLRRPLVERFNEIRGGDLECGDKSPHSKRTDDFTTRSSFGSRQRCRANDRCR